MHNCAVLDGELQNALTIMMTSRADGAKEHPALRVLDCVIETPLVGFGIPLASIFGWLTKMMQRHGLSPRCEGLVLECLT